MDEINDFFDPTKEFKREMLPSGYVNALPVVKIERNLVKRQFIGSEFGEEYRREELENLRKVSFDPVISTFGPIICENYNFFFGMVTN